MTTDTANDRANTSDTTNTSSMPAHLAQLCEDYTKRFPHLRLTGFANERLPAYETIRSALEEDLAAAFCFPLSSETPHSHCTPADIADFVTQTGNPNDDYVAQLAGFFSGALADIATFRRRQQGKPTRIHIDGSSAEKPFNYLFQMAHELDEVIVENMRGLRMLEKIGAYGTANSIIIRNCESNFCLVGAAQNARIGLLLADNVQGYTVGLHTGMVSAGRKPAIQLLIYNSVPGLDKTYHCARMIYLGGTTPSWERPEGDAFAEAVMEYPDGDGICYWGLVAVSDERFMRLEKKYAVREILSAAADRNFDEVRAVFDATKAGRKHRYGMMKEQVRSWFTGSQQKIA